MKNSLTIFFLIAITFAIKAQTSEPTQAQTIEVLKDVLNGQIIHLYYGGPCSNNSSISFMSANRITITNIKLNYDILQIEYNFVEGGKLVNNIKRINMNNNLLVYDKAIIESKGQTVDWQCKGVVGIALAFEENSVGSIEKTLKILNYMKKFITKSPFD